MSSKRTAALLMALGLIAALDAASAHGVDARQANQHERIRHGVAQGDLTRHEAAVLSAQQRRIAHTEARMRRDDGVLGPAERARLATLQHRASVAIGRQRHDHQRR